MTTTKTISALTLGAALFLAATSAKANDAQRGQVSISGQDVKAVVTGPVAIHAYSGFSGGTIYATLAVTGTDADCKGQPIGGTETAVRADSVVDFQVPAGQVVCLATTTTRPFELLWHAQKYVPTAPIMMAGTKVPAPR
jgi:hypothetical protein